MRQHDPADSNRMRRRARWGRWPVLAAALSALAGLALAGCNSDKGDSGVAASAGADRSEDMKATNLPVLNAQAKSLQDCKGRSGLLVIFVDTYCPFAAIIVGGVNTASDALAPHGVAVVLVNLDDPKNAVDDYYRQRGVKVPVLYDTTTATKERWKVTRVPTLVLLDAAGHEVYTGHGQWPMAAGAIETMMHMQPGAIQIAAESTEFT